MDQEAQEKLQEELDAVVGSDRWVTLADRPSLHYANAVIQVQPGLTVLRSVDAFRSPNVCPTFYRKI